jgi:hypothetical protein
MSALPPDLWSAKWPYISLIFAISQDLLPMKKVPSCAMCEPFRMKRARALSGLAWDAMRLNDVIGQQMVIEVRDAQGPVMEAKLSFEIARKARSLG